MKALDNSLETMFCLLAIVWGICLFFISGSATFRLCVNIVTGVYF